MIDPGFADSVRWTRDLQQRYSQIAVGPDVIVAMERTSRIVGLRAADGACLWDVRGPSRIAVSGETCLLLNDRLRCLDLRTGNQLWETPGPRYGAHLTVTGDTVLFGEWWNSRPWRAVDSATGEPLWSRAISASSDETHTVRPVSSPDGLLMSTHGNHRVLLLDPRTGRERAGWDLPEPLAVCDPFTPFVSIGAGRYLLRGGTDGLFELDLRRERVEPVYRHHRELLPDNRFMLGMRSTVEYAAGLVWLRELHGGLLALCPEDWRLLWRFDCGQPLAPGVVPLRDGFVVAEYFGGGLHRLAFEGALLGRTTITRRRLIGLRHLAPDHMLVQTKSTLQYVAPEHSPRPPNA